MKIHHLNCGTDCPLGGALFDGRSVGLTGRLVCHCLLIETRAHGLVLVDTGYGLRDIDHPHRQPNPRITRAMRTMLNIKLREQDTAIRQIEALGFRAGDVRHIVLTHLDSTMPAGWRISRRRWCICWRRNGRRRPARAPASSCATAIARRNSTR